MALVQEKVGVNGGLGVGRWVGASMDLSSVSVRSQKLLN